MISVYRFAHGKLFLVIRKPLCKLIGLQLSYVTGFFQGPTWRKSKAGAVLLANRRYDGSRSRKTKGSLADTFQCNIWRRAQTPGRSGVIKTKCRWTMSSSCRSPCFARNQAMKDADGRSVLKDCDCAMIDCLYDYAPGRQKCNFICIGCKPYVNQIQTLCKQIYQFTLVYPIDSNLVQTFSSSWIFQVNQLQT